jgi:phosphoserine phosphatase RsbU/P
MPNTTFELGEIELKPNDLLLAYTDGVVDARGENGASFTEERLLTEIAQNAPAPDRIVHHIIASLHNHIANQDQYDDITMLGLYRKQELEI